MAAVWASQDTSQGVLVKPDPPEPTPARCDRGVPSTVMCRCHGPRRSSRESPFLREPPNTCVSDRRCLARPTVILTDPHADRGR
jgi:hypothetical protein